MEYQLNHKTLPVAAVGTWAWGNGMNGSRMVFGTTSSIETLKQCFDKAYEDGFILWDTAAVYGMGASETILNECIKGRSILLSDKYTPGRRFRRSEIIKMLEASRQRLDGRTPDIYWLHTPKNLEQNLEIFCELVKQNKILSIGVSNVNLKQIIEADSILKKHGLRLAGVQNHYSLLYRNSEETGILDWCKANKVPFFAYMVLEQGALTGRFHRNHGFPMFSRRGFAFPKHRLAKIEALLHELELIGKTHELSVAETATAWAISKGTVPIVGVTKLYQAESLRKMNRIQLSDEEIHRLERSAQQTGVHIKAGWE